MSTIGQTTAGADDVARAADALAERLPEPLAVLARLAYNYRWSWVPGGSDVFRAVDRARWRTVAGNPVRLLQEASGDALRRAAGDTGLLARAAAVAETVDADLARPARTDVVGEDKPIAYFCAEFGFHTSMPIYSGGLGVLAGDVVKEASDRALPFLGVGLMYRRGYFRQRIDHTGWQQEFWVPTDPERTPAVQVTGADGAPVRVTVPVGEEDIAAHVWRIDVGRVPLFLLDADLEENTRVGRWTTERLYDSDPTTRLAQYALLGAGGAAALRVMGIEPGIVHMNEGHAAFAALESARADVERSGVSFDDALAGVRARTVFTTHTPVPAGNDTYPADQVERVLGRLARGAGTDPEHVIQLGRTHPDDTHEPFGVTQFALRATRAANGVSERHGGVSRQMWQGLWPDRVDGDVPITHVTNGVHVPSWVGAPMRDLLDRHLGEGWALRAGEPGALDAIEDVPAAELWAVRDEQRATLVDYIRDRSQLDRIARGEPRELVEAAARTFDPDVITVGFARRLATYKRLHLLLHDLHRSLALVRGDRPIQLLVSGKAHPKDDDGKRLVQHLFGSRWEEGASGRIVFMEDYDMGLAARLVRGCDVWLNVPRPPLEASGTSGMKSAVNGGLQLSVLDGWWAEGYDGENGWGISGDEDPDHAAQDSRHAAEMYRLLETEVVPEFYDRDGDGVPQAWVTRVKRSMRTNIPRFAATRMMADYEERVYRS